MRSKWKMVMVAAVAGAFMAGPVLAAFDASDISRRNWGVTLGETGGAVAASCSGGVGATQAACVADGGTWSAADTVSSSGVYEFNSLIRTAVPIMLLITMLWAGLMITKRVIRSFRGA